MRKNLAGRNTTSELRDIFFTCLAGGFFKLCSKLCNSPFFHHIIENSINNHCLPNIL